MTQKRNCLLCKSAVKWINSWKIIWKKKKIKEKIRNHFICNWSNAFTYLSPAGLCSRLNKPLLRFAASTPCIIMIKFSVVYLCIALYNSFQFGCFHWASRERHCNFSAISTKDIIQSSWNVSFDMISILANSFKLFAIFGK